MRSFGGAAIRAFDASDVVTAAACTCWSTAVCARSRYGCCTKHTKLDSSMVLWLTLHAFHFQTQRQTKHHFYFRRRICAHSHLPQWSSKPWNVSGRPEWPCRTSQKVHRQTTPFYYAKTKNDLIKYLLCTWCLNVVNRRKISECFNSNKSKFFMMKFKWFFVQTNIIT